MINNLKTVMIFFVLSFFTITQSSTDQNFILNFFPIEMQQKIMFENNEQNNDKLLNNLSQLDKKHHDIIFPIWSEIKWNNYGLLVHRDENYKTYIQNDLIEFFELKYQKSSSFDNLSAKEKIIAERLCFVTEIPSTTIENIKNKQPTVFNKLGYTAIHLGKKISLKLTNDQNLEKYIDHIVLTGEKKGKILISIGPNNLTINNFAEDTRETEYEKFIKSDRLLIHFLIFRPDFVTFPENFMKINSQIMNDHEATIKILDLDFSDLNMSLHPLFDYFSEYHIDFLKSTSAVILNNKNNFSFLENICSKLKQDKNKNEKTKKMFNFYKLFAKKNHRFRKMRRYIENDINNYSSSKGFFVDKILQCKKALDNNPNIDNYILNIKRSMQQNNYEKYDLEIAINTIMTPVQASIFWQKYENYEQKISNLYGIDDDVDVD